MEVPKKFRLMAHTWTIEPVQGTFDSDGDECNGVCDFSSLTIKINVAQPESMILHSFWHEVMHAVLWSLGNPLAADENFVDAVGGALAQVVLTGIGDCR